MPPGRGGKWHKEAASVPYWFGKSIRGAHFIPVYLCICHSVAHLKKCQLAAWEPGSCIVWKHLKTILVGKGEGIAIGHSLGGWASALKSCKMKAAWTMETWWIETLTENEGMGEEGKGSAEREGLEIQRLENQGRLGWKKTGLLKERHMEYEPDGVCGERNHLGHFCIPKTSC